MSIPAEMIERARAVSVESVVEMHNVRLRGFGVERVGPCPVCGGDDRFSVNTKKGIFNCRGCSFGGDVIALEQHITGCTFAEAVEALTGGRWRPSKPAAAIPAPDNAKAALGPIKAVYDYVDEAGALLFQALRFEPKQFRQRTGPNQKKWSIEGVRIVPFRLPELIEDLALEHTIFVVEGERDVITLRDLNVPATTNPMGAMKWRDEFNELFRGADVVICGDNDKPGRDHVEIVARNLHGVAKRVRALDLKNSWPDIGEGDDISDWLHRGEGTVEKLYEIVDRLPDWKPKINGVAAPATIPTAPDEDLAPEHSEEAFALRFADRYASVLRHVAAWSRWHCWTGVYWRSDDTLRAFDHARKIAREAAASSGAGKQRRKLAAAIASAKTVAAIERLAKADRRIAATIDQLDDNPDIFTPDEPGRESS